MSRRTLSTNRYAKVTITDIAHHRNGIGRRPFCVAVLTDTGHITGDYAARFARTAR